MRERRNATKHMLLEHWSSWIFCLKMGYKLIFSLKEFLGVRKGS